MPDLIACVGRRRIAVSKQDGNMLLRIMILDESNVLANLVLVPSEAHRLIDVLIDQSDQIIPRTTFRGRAKKKTTVSKPKA